METKQWATLDKSKWGAGEWQNEPDKVQWQDEATGLPCLAVRNKKLGNWCGYVGVPEGNAYYRKHYAEADVTVHGGLTFADTCQLTDDNGHGICHIPEPGEPDNVWWLGFDCAHLGDYSPGMEADLDEAFQKLGEPRAQMFRGYYRNLSYVKAECANLALQLAPEKPA